MDIGLVGHVIHNIILVAVYLLLGTIYLPGFVRRLDIPNKTRDLFKASLFVFFVLCAWTHFELLIHIHELPDDFFTASHNFIGFGQALGAIGFTIVLHPLIFPKKKVEADDES